MKKVILLGRGGAGKSTTAKYLSKVTGIPEVEIDKHFWQPGLKPTPVAEWRELQKKLTSGKSWIIDGDLGKYDAVEVRLQAADTILVLDFPLLLCINRARKRGKERMGFWWWLLTWRIVSRPKLLKAIKKYAPNAAVHTFRSPKSLQRFLDQLEDSIAKS